MMQRRELLIVLVLGAAILWSSMLLQPRTRPAPPSLQEAPAAKSTTGSRPRTAPTSRLRPSIDEAPSPQPLNKAPEDGERATADSIGPLTETQAEAEQQRPPTLGGPVDELKGRFENEPRDSDAPRFEREVEAVFDLDSVPASLLESVVCHRSVCRIQTRWTPDNADGFVLAFTALLMATDGTRPALFGEDFAIDPQGEPSEAHAQATTVYIRRLE